MVSRARSSSDSMVVTAPSGRSSRWSIPAATRSPLRLVRCTRTARWSLLVGQLAVQRPGQRRGVARVARGLGGAVVGQQVGLERGVEPVVQRLDLVGDRGEDALGERDQPSRGDADARAVGCRPLGTAFEDAGAQVQRPLVGPDLAVPEVERRVADVQADELAVGHVDDGLAGLREPVSRLGVGERALLVEAADVGARTRRAARPPPASRADRCARWTGRTGTRSPPGRDGSQPCGPQVPRFDQERTVRAPRSSLVTTAPSRSDRSLTTMSAPCSRSASAWSPRSTPTTNPKPPARPAATPASASSKTAAAAGSTAEQPGSRPGTCPARACPEARHGRRPRRPPAPRRGARCRRRGSLRRRWPRR